MAPALREQTAARQERGVGPKQTFSKLITTSDSSACHRTILEAIIAYGADRTNYMPQPIKFDEVNYRPPGMWQLMNDN